MSLSSYLFQRGKRGIWQLRVPVPRALHAPGKPKERIKSLATSDRRVASERAYPILASWQAEWAAAVGSKPVSLPPSRRHSPSIEELETASVAVAYTPVCEHEDRRRELIRTVADGSWPFHIRRAQINLDAQSQFAMIGDDSLVRDVAAIAIEEFGFDLPIGSHRYRQFVEYLNTARLAALRVMHKRATGDLEAETDSPLIARVRERQSETARSGEKLLELFERWATDRLAKGEKRADTVNQDRKVIAQFAAFVGSDRAIGSIRPVDVAEYRDVLRALPPKWRAKKVLADLDMRAAASKARELGLAENAFTTVNKHLSTISPLYKWLAAQPAWAGLVNPVTGLFHDKVKGKNRRPSFSTAQLNAILTSPLFTGFQADGREHRPGNRHADDWRKWIPLICLFTGARIGEIAQLRVGDVRQEHGVWFVHVRHDVAAGLSTKSGKSRPAALHPILERLGFLKFHKRQTAVAAGAATPLFAELRPNSRGQISGVPSRFWRDYLSAIGIKNGADGFGAHSFRHTLADRLRSEAELLDDQIEVVLGHNQESVTAGYGQLAQGTVTTFKRWMDALRFDGVDFSPVELRR